MTRLLDLIHVENPYQGFDKAAYPTDLQGWGSTDPIFSALFDKLRPRRVAEIGTWKGASALHMAQLANEYGIQDCEIVCIDTWLGSVEHWFFRERPDYFPSLKLKHGYPTLYMTFLANVIEAGAVDRIVPFPVASTAAARFLAAHGILFDLIYIDAAHQYDEVQLDVGLFWPLVRPGGVMFGDDYVDSFPGVIRAVDEFAAAIGGNLQVNRKSSNKWMIQREGPPVCPLS
ncbi:MAG: class I SAM-dependent methyltransferase [Dongiaceae bacterium]